MPCQPDVSKEIEILLYYFIYGVIKHKSKAKKKGDFMMLCGICSSVIKNRNIL